MVFSRTLFLDALARLRFTDAGALALIVVEPLATSTTPWPPCWTTARPTRLDKIKNFHFEVRAGPIVKLLS